MERQTKSIETINDEIFQFIWDKYDLVVEELGYGLYYSTHTHRNMMLRHYEKEIIFNYTHKTLDDETIQILFEKTIEINPLAERIITNNLIMYNYISYPCVFVVYYEEYLKKNFENIIKEIATIKSQSTGLK